MGRTRDPRGTFGAMWKVIALLALVTPGPGDGLFHTMYRNVHASTPQKGDVGEPLFLTPYIENGKILEGQELGLVSPFPGSTLKSYSGYLTVNKTYNSNLFFWFFPAQVQPMNAPVVLWLQGGPGSSSMSGLFLENGPYYVTENMTVRMKDFSWTTTFSVLYIDNPVGTGFSFTENKHGYAVNQEEVAESLYSVLVQFFQLFPEYKENDFYAIGESYAGKYVSGVAHYIHHANPTAELKINLKGIGLGNGFWDPKLIVAGYPGFLYQIGLVDEKQKKYFQQKCDECVKLIEQEEWLRAFEIFAKLLEGNLASEPTYFQNVTGCTNYGNFIKCMEPEDQIYYEKFLSLPEVRQVLHVGNQTFNDGSEVQKHLREDTLKSVKPWLAEIMNNYKVLVYNGQLDIIVAASLTERALLTVRWKGSREYANAERKVWKIFDSDEEVAGYVRQVGDFYQIIVRGGGHILPAEQPLRAFDMMNRFIFERGWEPYSE
ncbi:putative serine carboxypeptidase CPVL isoform X2 [Tamandua tetradactyla]|uniref:putative serine carboxypeptidase CPVL isoform X2 n=1 Tax=Tamandua tetradactyla TaxID=48850 RepID=UPI004053F80D